MPIILVGTLDTKGEELRFVRDLLRELGHEIVVIDAGSRGAPAFEPEFRREAVFEAAGTRFEDVQTRGDRGEAVSQAAEGVSALVRRLESTVEGILAIGGSAGTVIGTAAMRALPFGVPKVMVSTLASGQTRPYVAGSDLMLVPAVADIAGLNRITRTVLANAAHALAGMVRGRSAPRLGPADERPIVTATMFGVTTPCVARAREVLDAAGREVLVFHATGVGGQAMEGLIRSGQVAGVLDLTTTELADELVGGVLSAGPDRLEAAIAAGVPQVVSLGALDMVNFGPRETVPERFAHRLFHVHNAAVTLMRTTPEENAELGRRIATVLGRATAPVVVLVPGGGVSALDAPGQPFHDPAADAALFQALRDGLTGHGLVRVEVRPEHINDPGFAEAAAASLLDLMDRRERLAPTGGAARP